MNDDTNQELPMDEHTRPLGDLGDTPYAATDATSAAPATDPTSATEAGSTPSRWRHPVNTGHLVMGIAFAGLVAVWALFAGDVVDSDDVRWLMPIPWVVAGATGLAVTTAASLRTRGS